jgi:Tfp pilus assembly protein PilP
MVGSFTSSGVPYALVQTPAGLFHVAMGDMLGAEGARVVDLDDTQLNLRMRVKQENGRSTERQVRLAVRRAAKP